jgi:Dyp-type peroxidase family
VGMWRRSYSLGDPREATMPDGSPNPGHRSNWIFGGPGREAHVFLVLAGDREDDLAETAGELMGLEGAGGMEIVFEEGAQRLEGEREHFGFLDGISMPGVRGLVPSPEPAPLATRVPIEQRPGEPELARPGQPLVWPGQFILGYPIQLVTSYRQPGRPRFSLDPFARYGSFLVVRRLRQDVAAFYEDTARIAGELSQRRGFEAVTPELIRALIVGRWPSGRPLMRSPTADEGPGGDHRDALNHFSFARDVPALALESGELAGVVADLEGRVCPVFSHIRKVNPRDLPTDQGPEFLTLTFQMLRRGIPFGPPYDHGQDPSSEQNRRERGLMFLSYQASIERQFEVLNNKWMNMEGGPQAGGFDLLAGQNSASGQSRRKHATLLSKLGQEVVASHRDWVIPTGGGYFFAPSLTAIRILAGR